MDVADAAPERGCVRQHQPQRVLGGGRVRVLVSGLASGSLSHPCSH